MRFEIRFRGHECVRSLHGGTIEITRDDNLTPAGDCIVGVGAECACAGLPGPLKDALRDARTRVTLSISVGSERFEAHARGDPAITLEDERDLVIRRSSHVCARTAAVCCDASASSLPRSMVRALRDPRATGTLAISALA